jgi:hypothetical protein
VYNEIVDFSWDSNDKLSNFVYLYNNQNKNSLVSFFNFCIKNKQYILRVSPFIKIPDNVQVNNLTK